MGDGALGYSLRGSAHVKSIIFVLQPSNVLSKAEEQGCYNLHPVKETCDKQLKLAAIHATPIEYLFDTQSSTHIPSACTGNLGQFLAGSADGQCPKNQAKMS